MTIFAGFPGALSIFLVKREPCMNFSFEHNVLNLSRKYRLWSHSSYWTLSILFIEKAQLPCWPLYSQQVSHYHRFLLVNNCPQLGSVCNPYLLDIWDWYKMWSRHLKTSEPHFTCNSLWPDFHLYQVAWNTRGQRFPCQLRQNALGEKKLFVEIWASLTK